MESLPEELLQHIISFLDVQPPSQTANTQEPSLKLLFASVSPLKQLRAVSERWRRLVEPVLFKHLRICIDDELEPSKISLHEFGAPYDSYDRLLYYEWQPASFEESFKAHLRGLENGIVMLQRLDGFWIEVPVTSLDESQKAQVSRILGARDSLSPVEALSVQDRVTLNDDVSHIFYGFAKDKRTLLDSVVETVVVYSRADDPEQSRDKLANVQLSKACFWEFLSTVGSAHIITIICSPEMLAQLTYCNVDTDDYWSFDMPYQRVELRKSRRNGTAEDLKRLEKCSRYMPANSGNVLHLHHWDELEYDEGSSLNAYGTYHYFEKRPPSILNAKSIPLLSMGTYLHHFTYTATFPHYAHFKEVVQLLSTYFKALTSLRFGLAPSPTSKVLDDTERIGRGNLRLQDCWNELERCYAEVGGLMDRGATHDPYSMYYGGFHKLERVETLDWGNESKRMLVKGAVERILEGCQAWSLRPDECFGGVGVWVRGP